MPGQTPSEGGSVSDRLVAGVRRVEKGMKDEFMPKKHFADRSKALGELRGTVQRLYGMSPEVPGRASALEKAHTQLMRMQQDIAEQKRVEHDIARLEEEQKTVEDLQLLVRATMRDDHGGSQAHLSLEASALTGAPEGLGIHSQWDTFHRDTMGTQMVKAGVGVVALGALWGGIRRLFGYGPKTEIINNEDGSTTEKKPSWFRKTVRNVGVALGLVWVWNKLTGGGAGRGNGEGGVDSPRGGAADAARTREASERAREQSSEPQDVIASETEVRLRDRAEKQRMWEMPIQLLTFDETRTDVTVFEQKRFRNTRTNTLYTRSELIARLKALKQDYPVKHPRFVSSSGTNVLVSFRAQHFDAPASASVPRPFETDEYLRSIAQEAAVAWSPPSRTPGALQYHPSPAEAHLATLKQVSTKEGEITVDGVTYLQNDAYARGLKDARTYSREQEFTQKYRPIEELAVNGAAFIRYSAGKRGPRSLKETVELIPQKDRAKSVVEVTWHVRLLGPETSPPMRENGAYIQPDGRDTPCTVALFREELQALRDQGKPASVQFNLTFVREKGCMTGDQCKPLQALLDELQGPADKPMQNRIFTNDVPVSK